MSFGHLSFNSIFLTVLRKELPEINGIKVLVKDGGILLNTNEQASAWSAFSQFLLDVPRPSS